MPYKNKPAPKERPVIVVDKNNYEEYVVVPAYSKKRRHTTEYNKFGIKHFGHDLFVTDNEKKPIKLNKKFSITEKCSRLPSSEAGMIKDNALYHTPFSEKNKNNYFSFLERHKKSRD